MKKYQINYLYKTNFCCEQYYSDCANEEELLKELNKLKDKNYKIINIIEYKLIYEHPIKIPNYDYFHKYLEMDVFETSKKINKEDLITIKVKNYSEKIDKNNSNFEINYSVIEKHPSSDDFEKMEKLDFKKCFIKKNIVYSVKKIEEIKKELYSLSKSQSVFDIVFYQYVDVTQNFL